MSGTRPRAARRALPVAVCALIVFQLAPSPARSAAPADARGPIEIRGRVLAPGGAPVANADVRLVALGEGGGEYDALTSELAAAPPRALARILSDERGTFALEAATPGMYRVVVSAPGFAPARFDLAPLLDGRLLPDLTLGEDVGLETTVRDDAGAPVAGARVRLAEMPRTARGPLGLAGRDPEWRPEARSGYTDAEGRLRLARARGERLVVDALARGHLHERRENPVGRRLELRLARDPGRLVEVVDAAGSPVAGAIVALWPQAVPIGLTGVGGRLAVPRSDGGGSSGNTEGDAEQRLAALDAEGRRTVITLPAAAPAPPSKPAPAAAAAGASAAGATPTASIVLDSPQTVTGRLVDARSGRSVVGGLVWDLGRRGVAATSGAGGVFELTAPDPGRYRLRAAAPGFQRSELLEIIPALADHEPVIALAPAAAIEGVVRNESGEPVAGARLRVEEIRPPSGMIEIRISIGELEDDGARTDADGRYRLSPVDPDKRFRVHAEAEGFARASVDAPPLEPYRTAEDVDLTLGTGVTALGRVTDAEGEPLAGALVSFASTPPGGPGGGHGMRVIGPGGAAGAAVEATTDRDGRFEISGLGPGTQTITIERDGYATRELTRELAEGGPAELGTLALEDGVALQGLVVDEAGQPIEGVAIAARSADAGGMMFMMAGASIPEPDAVSGPNGWFSIGGFGAGQSVSLSLSREGYLEGKAPGLELPLSEPLTVTLEPSSAVRGVVLDAEERPIPGAVVELERNVTAAMGGRQMVMISREDTDTDEQGRFEFTGLSPGEIAIEASAPGYKKTRRSLAVERGEDLEGVEVPLTQGAIVRGRVLDSDGSPAIGASVGLVGEGEARFGPRLDGVTTDGEGFYLLDGVPEGPISIEARSEAGLRAVREIEARAGINELELQFEGGRSVSGSVLDPSGAPAAGAWVSLSPGGRGFGGPTTETDASGRFRFDGVRAGEYELRARHAAFAASKPRSVSVAEEELTGIDVALRRGGLLRGQIVGLDEQRLSEVAVEAFFGDGGDFRTPDADAQGAFQLENLAPGPWVIEATARGARVRENVDIDPATPETFVELRFGGGSVLTGTVVQNDRPIVGASVYVSGRDVTGSGFAETDSKGSFRIEGLETGEYTLTLRDWQTGLSYEEELVVDGDLDRGTIEIPTTRIAGVVRDASDGEPVSGVRLTIQAEDEAQAGAGGMLMFAPSTTSDLDGLFRIAPVRDGRWRIVASKRGYANRVQTLTIAGGESVDDLDIRLEPTEGLSLRVGLASGAVPDEVNVAVLDAAGAPVAQGRYGTGEGGIVRLSQVPAGAWELLASAGGSASVSRAVTAPGGPIDVSLPPATRLRIEVPELRGDDSLARAELWGADGRRHRSLGWFGGARAEWELRGGRGLIEGLAPGSWEVRVRAADGRSWTATATTSPGGEAEVVLD